MLPGFRFVFAAIILSMSILVFGLGSTAGMLVLSGLMGLPEDARNLGFRPSWLGYVGVNDVDAAADRIRELGGAVHVPPQDVPNVSRLSIAVDPQMATIAIFKWLNAAQAPPTDMDALGRVGWNELFAADWEKAWAFYGDLFGWQKEDADIGEMGTYQLFSAGGQMIGGMFTKPPAIPAPYWLSGPGVPRSRAVAFRTIVSRSRGIAGSIRRGATGSSLRMRWRSSWRVPPWKAGREVKSSYKVTPKA